MSLWLAAARGASTDEIVVASLGAVHSLTSDVEARLAAAGIAGISGALEAHRRLTAVLGAADTERLAAVQRLVAALEHELRHAARVLARLRALKETFEPEG